MRVILTDDVVGLGDIGETVSVRPGYARNFLVPRGLAIEAESVGGKATHHRMRQIEAKKRRLKVAAEGSAVKLKAATVQLELRVGEHGRVFGSITAKDIAEKLTALGYEIDRRRVLLQEPIKKLGVHPVRIRLHQEVETLIDVVVNPREATKAEIDAAVATSKAALERQADERRAAEEQEDGEEAAAE